MRKRILDIGSGLDPHPRATHAIDERTKAQLEKSNKRRANFKGVKFQGGVDYTKPVSRRSCNQFDGVISQYSLDVYGNQQAYKNAHCLLKCGGVITIRGGDTRDAPKVKRKLERAGFTNIKERVLPPPKGTTSPDYEIQGRKVCERGTPRSRR